MGHPEKAERGSAVLFSRVATPESRKPGQGVQ
jgi:hypothetical protein